MLVYGLLIGAGAAGVAVFVVSLLNRNARLKQAQVESQNLLANLQQRFDQVQAQFRLNLDGNTQLIQQQIGLLTKQIDDRLNQTSQLSNETSKQMNERLDNAARFFSNLQNQLGKIHEANEKIFNVSRDITSLHEILRNPKARGAVGELVLANLIAEMLPREQYELQYSFKNNEKVDAIVRVGDHLLPIDSKFPLENFKRLSQCQGDDERRSFKKLFISDVKKHIDSISKKYILPHEGTFDFACMYIPAENVFYEIITRDDELEEVSLHEHALKKRIIPVSPNSFYAYLGALMQALRGERMQKNIIEIIAQIRHLAVELNRFREEFDKIGTHLSHLRGSYEAADKRLSRYQDFVDQIQGHETATLDEAKPVKLVQ